MNHGLSAATVEEIREVLARFPEVEKAVLYGSRAKGNFRLGSDVDLTLLGPCLTLKIVGRIQDELEDGLLPYRFDISILDQITQEDLIDHIRRVGVPFYEKAPISAKR